MSTNQPPYQPDPRGQGYQQQPAPANEYVDNTTVDAANAGGPYVQRQSERYVDPAGNVVENRSEVYEDPNQARANNRYWTATITYFILAVLEIILVLRLFFRLLGANQGNSFISFLYSLSHVFVGPFNGIFNDQTIGNSSVFEVSTIIAMIIYALIAWGIVSLGRVVFAPDYSGQRRVRSTRRHA
jgi:hypothetical protein